MSYMHDKRAKALRAARPKQRQVQTQWRSVPSGYRHPSRKTGMSYHFRDWVNHYNAELMKLREMRRLKRKGKQHDSQ